MSIRLWQYFLSALIVSGEVLREVMELVQPVVQNRLSGHSSGCVLLGTGQGDIHDLGKNIVQVLLRCYGFTVYDLGVDVPPAEFAAQAHAIQPSFIGLSGLLTASYSAMRETVSLLQSAAEPGARPVPIIIGGQVDEQVSRYVGADYWVTDAMEGVRLCQRLVAGDNDRLAQAPTERQT
jgi:methanogenic corrinoid protein MtbC1